MRCERLPLNPTGPFQYNYGKPIGEECNGMCVATCRSGSVCECVSMCVFNGGEPRTQRRNELRRKARPCWRRLGTNSRSLEPAQRERQSQQHLPPSPPPLRLLLLSSSSFGSSSFFLCFNQIPSQIPGQNHCEFISVHRNRLIMLLLIIASLHSRILIYWGRVHHSSADVMESVKRINYYRCSTIDQLKPFDDLISTDKSIQLLVSGWKNIDLTRLINHPSISFCVSNEFQFHPLQSPFLPIHPSWCWIEFIQFYVWNDSIPLDCAGDLAPSSSSVKQSNMRKWNPVDSTGDLIVFRSIWRT